MTTCLSAHFSLAKMATASNPTEDSSAKDQIVLRVNQVGIISATRDFEFENIQSSKRCLEM